MDADAISKASNCKRVNVLTIWARFGVILIEIPPLCQNGISISTITAIEYCLPVHHKKLKECDGMDVIF